MKKLLTVAVIFVFTIAALAGVDPYNAYQNRMQLYSSTFYMTIDSLDALTRKLDSLISGQSLDTAGVSGVGDSVAIANANIRTAQDSIDAANVKIEAGLANTAILQTTANACSTYTDGVESSIAILQETADVCSVAVITTLPAQIQAARAADSTGQFKAQDSINFLVASRDLDRVADSTRITLLATAANLAKAQDSINYLVAGNDDIFTLVDTAAFRGWIPFLSGATSLPSETTDTIATVTGDVRIAILGFRVTTALAAEYIRLGFWANNADGVAAATALCDSAGMSDLTGSAAGVALNLTGVFANNPVVTAFNVAAVSGDPTAIRVKNCVLTVGSGTAVTASGKVRYYMLWQPVSTGSRVTAN